MKKDIKSNLKDDFWYEVKKQGITITDYNGKVKDVVIPDEIDGLPVVAIGDDAFKGYQLTNVVIPDSVVTIGKYAFLSNKLTDVIIPDSVKSIGESAFEHNQLTNVIIPDSVKSIGRSAFGGNKHDLMSVVLEELVALDDLNDYEDVCEYKKSKLAENPFSIMAYKNKITIIGYNHDAKDVVIPREINGLPVVAIENFVFSWNGLTNVIIPDSVKSIGASAFYGNNLTEIVIPDSVRTMGYGAFQSNQLSNVVISNSLQIIEDAAFMDNQLTDVIIPKSVKIIGGLAFWENKLSNVVIPKSVVLIEGCAFDENVKIIKEDKL